MNHQKNTNFILHSQLFFNWLILHAHYRKGGIQKRSLLCELLQHVYAGKMLFVKLKRQHQSTDNKQTLSLTTAVACSFASSTCC